MKKILVLSICFLGNMNAGFFQKLEDWCKRVELQREKDMIQNDLPSIAAYISRLREINYLKTMYTDADLTTAQIIKRYTSTRLPNVIRKYNSEMWSEVRALNHKLKCENRISHFFE